MSRIRLARIDPRSTGKNSSKEAVLRKTHRLQKEMYDLLYLMFAHNRHSLLIILQGIDTSGKDGVVRHLFASANPQGIRVYSFKKPTEVEVRHDFLWRCHRQVPECGLTTIFNRSYYEEVSTVRVHPELLKAQRLPEELLRRRDFFDRRFDHINDFERMLSNHGTVVMKFFLHISKDEQRSRLRDRLRDGKKNWKFSTADVRERKFWKEYQTAFEQMINATDTKWAPWHVLPADNKWYRDYLVSKAVVKALRKLKMKFPKANQEIDSIR